MSTKYGNTEELLLTLSEGLTAEDVLFAHYASDIAVAITSKRIALDLTQKEFAEKMGKSQAMISRWEGADCNFQLKTLIEIAQKLDLTLNISLNDTPAKNVSQKIIQFPGRYYGENSDTPVWTVSPLDEDLKEM